MNKSIRLHNTLTRLMEPLRTERPGRVTMYVCGPTVYNYSHIGNARPAVVFDVVEALRSDLNVPGAMARLHALLTQLEDADTDAQQSNAKSVLLASARMMGLLQQSPQAALEALRPGASASLAQPSDDAWIQTVLAEREQARRDRDFSKSDALRADLKAAGLMVEDTANGPMARPTAKEPA